MERKNDERLVIDWQPCRDQNLVLTSENFFNNIMCTFHIGIVEENGMQSRWSYLPVVTYVLENLNCT